MSAKSSNFAAETAENMTLEEMKHTAWRCRHSCFQKLSLPMFCTQKRKQIDERSCRKCPMWQASICAEQYFAGQIHGSHAHTLASIYKERVKNGRF